MTTSNPARIAVIGASGNGKSTVGWQLAEIHDVPYIELDALHHGPNWTEASADELTARVVAAPDPAPPLEALVAADPPRRRALERKQGEVAVPAVSVLVDDSKPSPASQNRA